jgi:DnaJ-class molecular chaperone
MPVRPLSFLCLGRPANRRPDYVLSDPDRRASYDNIRPAPRASAGNAGPGGFPGGFGEAGAAGGAGSYFSGWFGGKQEAEQQPDADELFGDVFEGALNHQR